MKTLKFHSYDADGNLRGNMEITPPIPARIRWSFNDDLLKTIDNAYNDALKQSTVSEDLILSMNKNLAKKKLFPTGRRLQSFVSQRFR